tara:strand:- start:980 stop:1867 length:888 start_codon:yes stop_codon:yes gene_type:complete
MKKIKDKLLITGSTGFVGSNFLKKIDEKKYEIHAPTRKTLDLNNYKLTKKFIYKLKPHFVVHLASRTNPKDRSLKEFEKQKKGTIQPLINLTKSLDSSLKLFISVGTIEEYGNCNSPFSERMLPKPVSSYGRAKLESLKIFQQICSENKINYVWLRPSLMFGKNMNSDRLIKQIINSYKYNQKISIIYPKSTRDYLYVDDFVKIVLKIISDYKNFKKLILNISSNSIFKNEDLVKKIIKLYGYNEKIVFEKNKTETMNKLINSSKKLNRILKNTKFTNFEKALSETFAHYGLKKK